MLHHFTLLSPTFTGGSGRRGHHPEDGALSESPVRGGDRRDGGAAGAEGAEGLAAEGGGGDWKREQTGAGGGQPGGAEQKAEGQLARREECLCFARERLD